MSKTYHFYKFPQNNSGGFIDVNKDLCEQDSKSCSSTDSLYCRIFYKNGEIKEIFKTKTNDKERTNS